MSEIAELQAISNAVAKRQNNAAFRQQITSQIHASLAATGGAAPSVVELEDAIFPAAARNAVSAITSQLHAENSVESASAASVTEFEGEIFPAVAAAIAAAAVSTTRITVQAYCWGFHFVIPQAVIATFEAAGASVAGFIAAIAGATGPAAPFVGAAAAYFALEFGLIKAVDKGRGCYLSMSWFAPAVFVPTAI